jgi:hypothetical protein
LIGESKSKAIQRFMLVMEVFVPAIERDSIPIFSHFESNGESIMRRYHVDGTRSRFVMDMREARKSCFDVIYYIHEGDWFERATGR